MQFNHMLYVCSPCKTINDEKSNHTVHAEAINAAIPNLDDQINMKGNTTFDMHTLSKSVKDLETKFD